MTTENLFADQANNVTQADTSTNQQTNQPVFTIPTEAVDYVGDGKKYKSVEDFANADINELMNDIYSDRKSVV